MQPFVGYLKPFGRFYVQGFVGINVPTDNRVVTMLYNGRVGMFAALTLTILLDGQWGLRESDVLLFGLVGVQMGWVLRPFIGDPDRPFAWFRERDSNFFQAVWQALAGLFS